jgi:hypothetical protein
MLVELHHVSTGLIAPAGIEPATSGFKVQRPSPAETPGLQRAVARGVERTSDFTCSARPKSHVRSEQTARNTRRPRTASSHCKPTQKSCLAARSMQAARPCFPAPDG